MLHLLKKTCLVEVKKEFRIMKKDGKSLFRDSNYRLTRTISHFETIPMVGDFIKEMNDDASVWDSTLGEVMKREIALKSYKKGKNYPNRANIILTLKPKEIKIRGNTFTDIELDDVHSIWLELFHREIQANKFKFKEFSKDDWELWDSWVEKFIEEELFPFDDPRVTFPWTPKFVGIDYKI